MLGPVGAGKSTFSRQLALERRALHLNLDDWMATLFSPDRPAVDVIPWYRERTSRSVAQIWKLACQMSALRQDSVLELGLITRGETFAMHVPPAIFELASDLWQPLEEDECPRCKVHHVRTD